MPRTLHGAKMAPATKAFQSFVQAGRVLTVLADIGINTPVPIITAYGRCGGESKQTQLAKTLE
eukprot:5283332-Alexandrium_andersonii.AAC.1